MKVKGIHQISIIVKSQDTVEFYKSTFGFQEVKRIERDNDAVVILKGFGIELRLFVDDRHAARSIPEPLGLRNIGFCVDDIKTACFELGLRDIVKTDWFGQRYVVITDPDGNQIQLHE
ncbi:MAG: VOC family protein [Clostridia bacterium]|nr:VOC family protein [Clostridia bacterium]